MNKNTNQPANRHLLKIPRIHFRLSVAARALSIIGVLVIGGVGIVQQAYAVQSMNEYCKKYTNALELYACKDTVKGIDCSVIASAFENQSSDAEMATKVCQTTQTDMANGKVSINGSGTPTPTPTPTTTPSTPATNNDFKGISPDLQNLLDQTKTLSQYLDILHLAGPDAGSNLGQQADNNYGSYVGGAGQQQPLRVMQQGSGSSPVILFINGGGWHVDDHTGDRVMAGEDGGENPWGRGYAMIEITYRLGSSGVYYMYEDVMRGIAHVINNAPLYGIDPNRVVIWGDSAGGSLAIRAAASGKTGAKASVGWSAITNAYTAFFRSLPAFAIGIDHSTCAPTDLAGLTNFTDLLAGGNGDVAEYGVGINSNDFSPIYTGDSMPRDINPLAFLSQGAVIGKNLLSTASNFETITGQIKGGNASGSIGSTTNLASKKFVECIDNFNALSPALYTSPDAPPAFMVEFENDTTVGPDQAWGYVDKLRQLGIQAEFLVPPGDGDCLAKAPDTLGVGCHLGYYSPFVRPTLDFLDKIIHPEQAGSSGTATPSGGGSSSGSGSSSSGSSGGSGGSKSTTSTNKSQEPTISADEARCMQVGGTYNKKTGKCNTQLCDTWQSTCNGGTALLSTNQISATNTPSGSSCPSGYSWHAGPNNSKTGAYCTKI